MDQSEIDALLTGGGPALGLKLGTQIEEIFFIRLLGFSNLFFRRFRLDLRKYRYLP